EPRATGSVRRLRWTRGRAGCGLVAGPDGPDAGKEYLLGGSQAWTQAGGTGVRAAVSRFDGQQGAVGAAAANTGRHVEPDRGECTPGPLDAAAAHAAAGGAAG